MFCLLGLCFNKAFSQKITLQLKSIEEKENSFINKIKVKNNFKDSIYIYKEIKRVSEILKNEGYFLNSFDSLVKEKKKYIAYFSLNKKIDSIRINTISINKDILKELNLNRSEINLHVKNLKSFNENITNSLEKKGYSFSKIQLKNFNIKENIVIAELVILKSTKRNIDKIIYQNYKDFPISFSKNYFNIEERNILNKKKIEEISELTKKLKFVDEIKPPEILFKKDSTYLYLYLEKKQNNSFDGLVNFSSEQNGDILFNGHIDLNLNNVLNKGEAFKLFWNRLGQESQELETSFKLPYIFKSKITPEVEFSIFKQDSTFINTKFNLRTSYQIKTNSNLNLIINSESSDKTIDIENGIENFENLFFGIGYEYKLIKSDFFNTNKFFLRLDTKFGQRITDTKTNQFKIESEISYIFDLNKRNSFYLRNLSGLINSNNFLQNEIYRIGGVNSIRGFNNKSIFANNYSVQNIEYRFTTSNKSYVYSITDLAIVNNKEIKRNLIGLGIGYLFTSNNSQINISSVIGNSLNNKFNFKNSQLLINWVTFF